MNRNLIFPLLLILALFLPSCEEEAEEYVPPYGRHRMTMVFTDGQKNLINDFVREDSEGMLSIDQDVFNMSVFLNGREIVTMVSRPNLYVYYFQGEHTVSMYVPEIEDYINVEAYYERGEPMVVEFHISSFAIFGDEQEHVITAQWKKEQLQKLSLDDKELSVGWIIRVHIKPAKPVEPELPEEPIEF